VVGDSEFGERAFGYTGCMGANLNAWNDTMKGRILHQRDAKMMHRSPPGWGRARPGTGGRLSMHKTGLHIKAWYMSAVLILVHCALFAQNVPKRELRAAWVATVVNIDWPSERGLSTSQQQQEFVKLLDTLQQAGMNAVIVQVRPTADALYPSSYEPWSEYLSGVQGHPSQPYYNPLAFMINEARKRGLEFHAWFNPYRASMNGNLVYAANHPIRSHPEWFLEYGGRYYYDPGHPAAREFVLQSIMETVRHYDLDAVHFDDYFYPYRIANTEFPDSCSYDAFGREAYENIDDWRRSNVDFFVHELSGRIRSEKPHLKFGISPFGVWRNIDRDSTGSHTRAGQTNYDDLYADVLKWLREGWIDYVTPQLYWHIGFELADYRILAEWWSRNSFGRHLYIGQGLYRMGAKGWEDPDELVNQVGLNRTFPQIQGSMYYSAKFFMRDDKGVPDMMRRIYPHKALVPVMSWLSGATPGPPKIIDATGSHSQGVRLEWKDTVSFTSAYYVVYRFGEDDSVDIENPAHIRAIVQRAPYATQEWTDSRAERRTEYVYVVTAVDRLHNESTPSEPVRIKVRGKRNPVKVITANAPAVSLSGSSF
jgi:uncharacterized lipoprotein YddW (UPF0748 family)